MEQSSSKRLIWVDTLRGFTVISMVLYHLMWDIVFLYNGSFPWYHGLLGHIWQQSICWSFIFLSGFSLRLGTHPVKRGAEVFLFGAAVTLVTLVFMPEDRIIFGVLTLIGSSMIIVGLLKQSLIKLNPTIFTVLSFILFLFTKNINNGYLGLGGVRIVELPRSLYANYFTSYLGFLHPTFYSTDYFSIFPWIFLFLCGFFFYGLYKEHIDGQVILKRPVPIINLIGRKALLIYILHQPVIYAILYFVKGR